MWCTLNPLTDTLCSLWWQTEHPGVFAHCSSGRGLGLGCVGAEGRITSQHPLSFSLSLSLSLLTCPTCLQSTIALSFGPHRRGCSRESHIQRATEKQGQQIGTRGYSEAAIVLVCEAFNWRVVKTSVWQGIIESLFEPSSCCSYSKYAHISIQSHYSEINLSHHTQVRHPARYISILKADGWCTRLVKRRASAYSGAERRKNKMHYSILSQDTNKCRGSPAAS